MKPTYYIQIEGKTLLVSYKTQAEAVDKAENIASHNPDLPVEVLKSVSVSSMPKTITYYMDGESPK